MYSYVSATLRKVGKNQRWESTDISQMTLSTLQQTYRDGFIVLTNTLLSGLRYVSLKSIFEQAIPIIAGLTFEQWLVNIGNRFLTEMDTTPTFNEKHCFYSNAIKASFHFRKVHPVLGPDDPIPEGDKTDLLLTKTGIDTDDLGSHVMVSVGGYWHLIDTSPYGLKVKDGAKMADLGQRNSIGLLSFKNVAPLTYHPIDLPMLAKADPAIPYKQEVLINFDIDATGKSPILVIGGYLHLNDNTFTVINWNPLIIKVHVDKLSIAYRYFESRRFLDLSSFNMTVDDDNIDKISVAELHSDAVIEQWMTLIQSFLVLVDTPTLYFKRHSLATPMLPGTYETALAPKYPVQTNYGRMPEYWYRETESYILQDGKPQTKYLLSMPPMDNTKPCYVFPTTRWESENAIDDRGIAQKPNEYATGYFVEIGSQQPNFL